jgi:hypothetical protein
LNKFQQHCAIERAIASSEGAAEEYQQAFALLPERENPAKRTVIQTLKMKGVG